MIIEPYDIRLGGVPRVDPMPPQLSGCCTFSKRHHTFGTTLQIWMHVVCCSDQPYNGIRWICLQGELHSLRFPDVMYPTSKILLFIPVRIADSRGEESQCRLEVGSWPTDDGQYICHKSPEKVGLSTHQCVPILYHCEYMVSCWGLGDAFHVICWCLKDALDMFSHSYAYLAFCAIIEPHTEVVIHVALTDR